MADPLTDLAVVIIGAFIGALLAFFIPRFFGWKGEYRNERMTYLTKLIEQCYGPLRYHLLPALEQLQAGKQRVLISVFLSSWLYQWLFCESKGLHLAKSIPISKICDKYYSIITLPSTKKKPII